MSLGNSIKQAYHLHWLSSKTHINEGMYDTNTKEVHYQTFATSLRDVYIYIEMGGTSC